MLIIVCADLLRAILFLARHEVVNILGPNGLGFGCIDSRRGVGFGGGRGPGCLDGLRFGSGLEFGSMVSHSSWSRDLSSVWSAIFVVILNGF
jgi:hypothetical protein